MEVDGSIPSTRTPKFRIGFGRRVRLRLKVRSLLRPQYKKFMTLIPYLFIRLLYRLIEFLRHWYLDSFKIYSHFIISLLEKFDRRFAFKITLRNLFQPLYQDRSLIGYTLGFSFRTSRLIIGGIIYIMMLSAAMFFYLAWLAVPIYIIFKIIYA